MASRLIIIRRDLLLDIYAARACARYTLVFMKKQREKSDYGLGMDLVSKLVPVTENLKPTAHFIFEKWICTMDF